MLVCGVLYVYKIKMQYVSWCTKGGWVVLAHQTAIHCAWRPAHMVKFQTLELNMGDAGPSVASFLILCTCQQRGGPAHD